MNTTEQAENGAIGKWGGGGACYVQSQPGSSSHLPSDLFLCSLVSITQPDTITI